MACLSCERYIDLEERVIMVLGESGEATAREISLVLGISMAMVRKVLGRLEVVGLLKEV